MRSLAPDYYTQFTCIADRCRHTCCKGWEIDVDEASQQRFAAVPGPLGQRLRDAMVEDDDGVHFALQGAEERCPFLDQHGLCDLITNLGPDCLCQICADHPRFRSFWTPMTELGLGLCCEEAARLILTWQEPVCLTLIGNDGGPAPDLPDDEADLLQFRGELIAIAQDRSRPIDQRMLALPDLCGCSWPAASAVVWAFELLKLERLDPAWTTLLQQLKAVPVPEMDLTPWALPLEQLMVYLLYRHMPAALEDGLFEAHLLVCLVLWQTVVWMFAQSERSMDTLIELCRMMSAEIEYSQENLDALLELLC